MLNDNLVIWPREGRTLMVQGTDSNHHFREFEIAMSGARVRERITFLNTNELTYYAVGIDNKKRGTFYG